MLEMVLSAVVAAIAPATPTIPPAMLKATAPATASMVALLAASIETSPAVTRLEDPVIWAVVVALMRFSTPTPAPDSATPTWPAAAAPAPATTSASIRPPVLAVTPTDPAPTFSTLLSSAAKVSARSATAVPCAV